ncbi:MAG: DUF1761 domain-containing protein [Saprospiraceae bacterium]|nr:DUF1761 domain-containing protein [Saprospiraceae bacterium]
MENSINWLSMIIAALMPMAVGMVYYHKKVAGAAWMDSIGMTEEKAKEANMPLTFGLSLIMAFLIAFFLLQFNNGAGQEGEFDTFQHGMAHGVVLSIFLVIPIFITNGLFEQKSWKNIFLNIGYWIITLALMGGVVDAMNHFQH